jgi:hypothetical protein
MTSDRSLDMPKLPSKEKKHMLSCEIEETLLAEIKKQAEKRGVSIRSIVEFGLEAYLETVKK